MPPQGGDPPCVTLQSGPSELQSTPPHGRRRWRRLHQPAPLYGFNPRLRTGGDIMENITSRAYVKVSIHASAREATRPRVMWARRGAFQSTPPHGRRRTPTSAQIAALKVSIPASAREATNNAHDEGGVFERFNPRLRTGGDFELSLAQFAIGSFQSTPPHGRRPVFTLALIVCSISFNPRLRTGGDLAGFDQRRELLLFQSTPPHGWRRKGRRRSWYARLCFNPRLRTGGDG